jgi:hypothetical protein
LQNPGEAPCRLGAIAAAARDASMRFQAWMGLV